MNTETQQTETPSHKIIATGIKRELPCKLNDPMLIEIATVRADLEAELRAVEDEYDSVQKDWKKRISDLEKRIERLGGEIHDRERKQVVICHERVDAATRMVEVVREDTDEVVDRRVATLFEAAKVLPEQRHVAGDEVAAPGDDSSLDAAVEETEASKATIDAMKAQEDKNVEETEDGDVVVPDTAAPKAKRKAKK